MKKYRKQIFLSVAIVLSLSLCWLIGQALHTRKPQEEFSEREKHFLVTQDKEQVLSVNELLDMEAITYEGSTVTEDNPWNTTAGTIELEDRGSSIFLTPNTSAILPIASQTETLTFSYEIHPWVKESSDGAGLTIWLMDSDNTILHTEELFVDSMNELKEFQLDLSPYQNIAMLTLLCNNGSNSSANSGDNAIVDSGTNNGEMQHNDVGDWIVLSNVQAEVNTNFGKTDYVKSATYFADEWPINFWNSEMNHLKEDMQQIKQDGFNSIILVIPWREFQPCTNPITYNDYAFGALKRVVTAAKDNELDVYVRIGYSWDFYNDAEANIVDQFAMLLGDKEMQDAWFAYVEKVYSELSQHDNFKGGFLTWEDQWNTLGMCDEEDLDSRLRNARDTGYQEWVNETYGLEGYNEEFGTDYHSIEEIILPGRDEPAMYAMYEFYDCFLNVLLYHSQTYFPNLSMEVRIDWDVTYDKDGELKYFEHDNTYFCQNSDFVSLMYGIPIGYENVGERVSYTDALEKTAYVLQQLNSKSNGKGIYVEQFIFADNTPKFADNAQIKADEVDDYLLNVSEVLQEYSEGYGIWTYRNYCANMLYNSQFALLGEGWDVEGSVNFEELEPSNVCTIGKGGSLKQHIPEIRNHFDGETYLCTFEVAEVMEAAKLEVSMGSKTQVIEVSEAGKVTLSFAKNKAFDLELHVKKGQISIDNIKLYSQVQEGFLYDEEGQELSCIESLRILNQELD